MQDFELISRKLLDNVANEPFWGDEQLEQGIFEALREVRERTILECAMIATAHMCKYPDQCCCDVEISKAIRKLGEKK